MALICGTATAHRRPCTHHVHGVTTVVTRPAVTVLIGNRFNQRKHLARAIAYLNNNQYLSVKEYARITELTPKTAEAELDAFVQDTQNQ